MALNIKNQAAEELAKELARLTGETLTQAVITALRHRLAVVRERGRGADLHGEIADLQAFVRAQPDRDRRTPDEILGYDDRGLPK